MDLSVTQCGTVAYMLDNLTCILNKNIVHDGGSYKVRIALFSVPHCHFLDTNFDHCLLLRYLNSSLRLTQ